MPSLPISFVVLTWNSAGTVLECIRSIGDKCREECLEHEILVVDNGSRDATMLEIAKALDCGYKVRVIALAENRGTTVSRNIALRESRGSTVCVMDSDAMIIEGSLSDILAALDDRSIGIIAPRLLLPDGTTQRSVKPFPSALGKLLKIPQIVFKTRSVDVDAYADFPFQEPRDVDTAISACWLFRRSLLDDVGLLDEKIFYSPEDVDFCIRVRKVGKRIVYDPHFLVLHHTQQITHRKVISRHAFSHLMGLVYLFSKHRYFVTPQI